MTSARGYHVSLKGLDVSDQLVEQALQSSNELERCYSEISKLVCEKKNTDIEYLQSVTDAIDKK
jgi:hypothetical protein